MRRELEHAESGLKLEILRSSDRQYRVLRWCNNYFAAQSSTSNNVCHCGLAMPSENISELGAIEHETEGGSFTTGMLRDTMPLENLFKVTPQFESISNFVAEKVNLRNTSRKSVPLTDAANKLQPLEINFVKMERWLASVLFGISFFSPMRK